MSETSSQAMDQLLSDIRSRRIDRRAALRRGLALGLGASAIGGLFVSGNALAQTPAAVAAEPPAKPVSLTVIDVAGQAQLTQAAIEDYVDKNPDWEFPAYCLIIAGNLASTFLAEAPSFNCT